MQNAPPAESKSPECRKRGDDPQHTLPVEVVAASGSASSKSDSTPAVNSSPQQIPNAENLNTTKNGALLVHASSAGASGLDHPEQEDNRVQPWQSIIEEIERQGILSPPGSDYFPCRDGFFAHSLAG